MKQKASVVAQRLLNLYRQEHVIFGGWAAVNKVFVKEANAEVIKELGHLPTGGNLVKHIANLRQGTTKMDTILPELMPYGGMMTESVATISLTPSEWKELQDGIENFTPTEEGLNALQKLPVVQRFKDEWLAAIRPALRDRSDLQEKWDLITKTYRAYYLWNVATSMLDEPISERTRAQLQADMPEYETYLPMFGDSGLELLAKLRNFITTRKPFNTDNAPNAPQSV